MVEQTNDVLAFFNVFEKTYTLHGIQGQQVVRILPSLLNEKANKNLFSFGYRHVSIE